MVGTINSLGLYNLYCGYNATMPVKIRTNNYIGLHNSNSAYGMTVPISFCANTSNKLEKVPEQDSLETSKQSNKKKLSTAAKLGITAGIIGTIATAALLIKKNRYSEVKQLAENITFTKATSIEEAMNFGKKHLGIRNYSGFEATDLEVLNWINEGLVNTSNKLHGKLRVPKNVQYVDDNVLNKALAGVITEGKYSGFFGVNKDIFRNLESTIEKNIKDVDAVFKVNPNHTYTVSDAFNVKEFNSLAKSIEDFNAKKMTTFDEKIKLLNELYTLKDECHAINNAPLVKIRTMLNKENVMSVLKKNNIQTNIQKIEKMSFDKQFKLMEEMLSCCRKNKLHLYFGHDRGNPFQTIYHEMGHLQDDVIRPFAKHKYKSPEEYPPELKEWFENAETQQIASSISDYACSGPGEFIAETFAELVAGNKVNKSALELYKKLNGPEIPGM